MEMAAYLPVPLLPPSAPVELDLRGLSPHEIARIHQVLARFDRANQVVEQRTNKAKNELENLKSQVEVAAAAQHKENRKKLCQICYETNVAGVNISHVCSTCFRKFCSSCGCRTKTGSKRGTPTEWMCSICYKERRYLSLSGNWMSVKSTKRRKCSTESAVLPSFQDLNIFSHRRIRSVGNLLDGDDEYACLGLESDRMGPCGRIMIQLGYIQAQSSFIFTIICAEGLRYADSKDEKWAINPYAKAFLLPDRSCRMKRKTATLQDAANPNWRRSFMYENISLEELRSRSLEVSVWSQKKQKPRRVKKHLGQVTIDLSRVALDNLPRCYPLSCCGAPAFTPGSPPQISSEINFIDGGMLPPVSPISSCRNSFSSIESSVGSSADEKTCGNSAGEHKKEPMLAKIGQFFSRDSMEKLDHYVMEYKQEQEKMRRKSEIEEVSNTMKLTESNGGSKLRRYQETASLPRNASLNIPENDTRRHSLPNLEQRARSSSPAYGGKLSLDYQSGINPRHLSPMRRFSKVNETYSLSPSDDGSIGSTVSALHPSEGVGLGVGQLLRSAQLGVGNTGQIQLGFCIAHRRLEITVYSAKNLVYKSEHLTYGSENPPYVKLYLLHDTKPISGQKEQKTKCGTSVTDPQFGETLTFKTTQIHNKILKIKVKYDTSKRRSSHGHEIGQALVALDDLKLSNEEVKGWYKLFPTQN